MTIKIIIICCALTTACAAVSAQEGMAVVRDAVTGKLRAPTAAELRAMQSKAPKPLQMAAPQPRSSVRADGTRQLELGERGMVYSVMTRSLDGTLASRCLTSAGAAQEALEQNKEKQHEHL